MVHPEIPMIARGSRLSSNRSIDLQSGEYWRVLACFAGLLSISFMCSPAWVIKPKSMAEPGASTLLNEKKIIDVQKYHGSPWNRHPRAHRSDGSFSKCSNLSLSIKLTNQFGRVALARRYQLHRADCPDVPALIQLVLEEFLRNFRRIPGKLMPMRRSSRTRSNNWVRRV